ncbi:hypothetical protein U4I65_02335 [Stenotrophomonas maltophilia]|uniref:hypothetical protein n=1 Tax=Stenotrophomonas maltophilia TaxID=40324 RepID=UPI002ACCE762|nr:hypothetical protein [Stenotrophomonas maltophilia]MDZ5813874.1 hypothetical protein [Stenotrophomonas maltophilia]
MKTTDNKTAPVDVLAVMDDAAEVLLDERMGSTASRLECARAAVAELIEAETEFDEAAMEVSWYEAKTPYRSRNYRTACYVRQREAIARRTAALARVKGESA